MNCVASDWGDIPTLVLGHIYEYLEPKDRLRASLSCSHWREVVFQKRFFQNFKFSLNISNDRQCQFFHQKLCHFTSVLTIIFDFRNIFHIERIKRILYKIVRCDNLQGIRFKTHNVGRFPPGDMSEENLIDIEQFIVQPLKLYLCRKKAPCKILDLGAIEALTCYGIEFLKVLGKSQALQQLTLASIKYEPNHYSILVVESNFLQRCSSLQVLSLDYDSMNDEILHAIQVLPLKKLLICVHCLDRQHPGMSEIAWAEFANNFNNIELVLSLIYAYEAVEVLQVRLLRRNMPITHLRVLFCDFINVEALDWMSINNNNTLKSIQWIDSAYKHSDKNVMDLFLRSGQDPFVMISWRCKNLEEIVIHGYVLDPHNIVGISRLRGRTLKRLEVSMIDTTPTEANMDTFVEEISTLLGQNWEPSNLENLHPALGYHPVSEDARDEFVFDLMQRDISK